KQLIPANAELLPADLRRRGEPRPLVAVWVVNLALVFAVEYDFARHVPDRQVAGELEALIIHAIETRAAERDVGELIGAGEVVGAQVGISSLDVRIDAGHSDPGFGPGVVWGLFVDVESRLNVAEAAFYSRHDEVLNGKLNNGMHWIGLPCAGLWQYFCGHFSSLAEPLPDNYLLLVRHYRRVSYLCQVD